MPKAQWSSLDYDHLEDLYPAARRIMGRRWVLGNKYLVQKISSFLYVFCNKSFELQTRYTYIKYINSIFTSVTNESLVWKSLKATGTENTEVYTWSIRNENGYKIDFQSNLETQTGNLRNYLKIKLSETATSADCITSTIRNGEPQKGWGGAKDEKCGDSSL